MSHTEAMAVVCLAALGCGGKPSPVVGPLDLFIVPASVSVAPGAKQQFAVSGSAGSVTWSVLEGTGAGTISSDGLYAAPAAPGVAHVVATSTAHPEGGERRGGDRSGSIGLRRPYLLIAGGRIKPGAVHRLGHGRAGHLRDLVG